MTVDQMPFYPAVVQQAVTAIHYLNHFKKFTGATRTILTEIVIRLDKNNPTKPIWFKRANVAARLQLDRKTVYNALTALETHGLIQRQEQETDSWGYFTCATIKITEKLVSLLGFNPISSDRGEKTEHPTSSYSNNNLTKQPKGQPFNKNQKKPSLFNDPALLSLKEAGLSEAAIFLLMKICKPVGQRLSNVVNYVSERLKSIKNPREIFAYLKRCIEANKDYHYLIDRRKELLAQEEQDKLNKIRRQEDQQMFKQKIIDFATQHNGKIFKAIRTGDLYEFSQDGWARNTNSGGYLNDYEFYTAFKAGKFEVTNIEINNIV